MLYSHLNIRECKNPDNEVYGRNWGRSGLKGRDEWEIGEEGRGKRETDGEEWEREGKVLVLGSKMRICLSS